MGEFLDKYGGVIIAVICIVGMIGIASVLFSGDTESGLGKTMKMKIESITAGATN